MKLNDLRSLNEDALHDYFNRAARFCADAPANCCYIIKVGSIHLSSGDTAQLWRKFRLFVRQ